MVSLTPAEDHQPDERVIQAFTDGSKHLGGTGSGAIIKYKFAQERCHAKLPDHATVFQGELVAVKLVAEHLLQNRTKGCEILIHSDSQAALLALENNDSKSRLCAEVKEKLNRLASKNALSLHWVRGHSGNQGNEEADAQAKRGGGATPTEENSVFVREPRQLLKRRIQEEGDGKWRERWENSTVARRTKLFFPSTQNKDTLKLARKDLSNVIQFCTGFSNLRNHTSKITKGQIVNFCRICGDTNEKETPEHLTWFCERTRSWARSHLGEFSDGLGDVTAHQMASFISSSRLKTLLKNRN